MIYALTLLYTPKYLFLTPISLFSSFAVPLTYIIGSPYTLFGPYLMTVRARRVDEGGGRGHVGGEKFVQVCARDYSVALFIARSRCPILSRSLAPSLSVNWEGNIHGCCGRTTS